MRHDNGFSLNPNPNRGFHASRTSTCHHPWDPPEASEGPSLHEFTVAGDPGSQSVTLYNPCMPLEQGAEARPAPPELQDLSQGLSQLWRQCLYTRQELDRAPENLYLALTVTLTVAVPQVSMTRLFAFT